MFNSIFNEGSLFPPLMNRRFTRVSRFAEARTTFWHVLSCFSFRPTFSAAKRPPIFSILSSKKTGRKIFEENGGSGVSDR